jgi:2-oxoisovalerate dehydrogenase E1 component
MLSSIADRFVGENSIVAAGAPIAAGLALAAQRLDREGIAVVSLGDGAMNQGSLHEALVFATAEKLPMVFVCENNAWSEMTPTAKTIKGPILDRVEGYPMSTRHVDGCDPNAVFEAMTWAREQAVSGQGPVFLECETVRLKGHYNRDIEHYRSASDRAAAEQRDPLLMARRHLEHLGDDAVASLEAQMRGRLDSIVAQVLADRLSDPATVLSDVFAADAPLAATRGTLTKEMTYQRAANAAIDEALRDNADVLVYGEDVGVAGGIFGVTRGLQKQHGERRVFDTPISESAILGSAVGAAIAGARPVVEIMWADFMFVALDQLVNQAANVRYVSAGLMSAPMVVRTQQGVTPGSCAQHSQSVEAILAHVPGLRVGLPATSGDAYSMLAAAIRSDDPCVIIESRALYQVSDAVELGAVEPASGARTYGDGDAGAIITWGPMVPVALEAAEELRKSGTDVRVVDLRWLNPLDTTAIDATVRAVGGRILVVHEAVKTGGFGAEIIAGILERNEGVIGVAPRRLAMEDIRMPAAPSLQDAVIPSRGTVVAAMQGLISDRKIT